METNSANEILHLYKRKTNLPIIIILLSGIALAVFLPINIVLRILLAILFVIVASLIVTTTAIRKYVNPILSEELDPQKFYTVCYGVNNRSYFAKEEIAVAFLLGDYDSVVNICSQKLTDKGRKSQKTFYLTYLARVYFYTGDFEKLNDICDDIYKLIKQENKDEFIEKYLPMIAYFKHYLAEDFDYCKTLYKNLLKNERFCNTKLSKIQINLLYAISCYKTQDYPNAKILFEYIVSQAPKLNYSKIAQQYLSSINSNEEFIPEKKEIIPDENYKMPKPEKQPVNKKRLIVGTVAFAIFIIIICGATMDFNPTTPFETIAKCFRSGVTFTNKNI